MKNRSPFIPSGSFLERERLRSRSKIKAVIFIVLGFHAVLLGVVLIQGCRRDHQDAASTEPASPNSEPALPNVPTNSSALAEVSPTNTLPTFVPLPVPVSNAPVITEPFAPVQAVATKDYRVVKGDTLSAIAKRQRIRLSALTEANPGIDAMKLKVGQILQVPENSDVRVAPAQTGPAAEKDAASRSPDLIYVVKRGDTLSKIAHVHGTTTKAIRDLNHLKSDQLMVGRKLKLPPRPTFIEGMGAGLPGARA